MPAQRWVVGGLLLLAVLVCLVYPVPAHAVSSAATCRHGSTTGRRGCATHSLFSWGGLLALGGGFIALLVLGALRSGIGGQRPAYPPTWRSSKKSSGTKQREPDATQEGQDASDE